MKISQADANAVLPELLSDPDVPAQVSFGFESEVISENFVLTAWRTESGRHTGVQNCVCPVNLVSAGDAISPDAAELIEVIEAAAGDKDQILNRRQRRLQESGDFFRVIAYKCWLRSKNLQNKWALLSGVDSAVEKAGGEREPRRWTQIILIINLRTFKEGPSRADKAILVRIVQLSLMIVAENKFVVPPVSRFPIDMRAN